MYNNNKIDHFLVFKLFWVIHIYLIIFIFTLNFNKHDCNGEEEEIDYAIKII